MTGAQRSGSSGVRLLVGSRRDQASAQAELQPPVVAMGISGNPEKQPGRVEERHHQVEGQIG